MTCTDVPSIQLGARGALIDFLFVTRNADGTTSPVDLSSALSANEQTFALFRKPRQGSAPPEIVRVPLEIVAPATDGRARYATEDGWLDLAGEWSAQGFVTFAPAGPTGSFIPSEVVVFTVKANLRPFTPAPTVEPDAASIGLEAPTPTIS